MTVEHPAESAPVRYQRSVASNAASAEAGRVTAMATIGGLLLVAGVVLALLFEQFRPMNYLVYVFMLGLAPPLSALLVSLSEDGRTVAPATTKYLLVAVKAFLLSVLLLLVGLMLIMALQRARPLEAWLVIGVCLAGAGALAVRLGRPSALVGDVSGQLDAYLVVAFAVMVFVLSPFNPTEPVPFGLVNYALTAPHFALWGLVGILWTVSGIWLRRHEGWAFPRRKRLLEVLAISTVFLMILGLYDDGHFVDFSSFAPIVGPAMHAMHGGIPMVDTFSQYGFMPWFIVRLAFDLFTPGFGTAAVVMRLFNLGYFLALALIMYFVARRRVSALWFFVPALLVSIMSHGIGDGSGLNMNSLPMAFGARYLVPASMALLMVAAPGRPWTRWVALAIIMVASVFAVEQLVFTLAPWGYCTLLDAVRKRSVRHLLCEAGLACGAIAIAQLALVAVILFSTGAIVDYGTYFNLVSRFRPSEDSHWSVPFVPYYVMWLPIGASYFLVLAMAAYRAWRGAPPGTLAERLVPVVCLGLGPLSYFFGRPQEPALSTSCLPFAVVAIGVAEVVFLEPWRFGSVGRALFVTMSLTFAFAIADGFERFMQPMDPKRGNATVLRRCFTADGCRLGDVPRNIDLALHTQPLDRRTNVGYAIDESPRNGRERTLETISMLRRLAPHARYVGLLSDYDAIRFADSDNTIGLVSFMATGQWFAWSISSPLNDSRSPRISRQILERVASTQPGLLIIAPNDRVGWDPINQKIWDTLAQHCRLPLVEQGTYSSAFMTAGCHG